MSFTKYGCHLNGIYNIFNLYLASTYNQVKPPNQYWLTLPFTFERIPCRVLVFGFFFILADNLNAQSFITTWKTDNPGETNDNQIMIPTTGGGYNYDVDWGDGNVDTNVIGNITHTYTTPGTYMVSISGAFPRIYFNGAGFFGDDTDFEKILTVEQWGDIAWTSMVKAFSGCENLRINATDTPDLSLVTDMGQMFEEASALNDDINSWDVSNVTNMSGLFEEATSYNQPLNTWNVSNVSDMGSMLSFTALSTDNYDQTLIGWESLGALQTGVNLGADGLIYCLGETARNDLIFTFGWNITGDALSCPAPFVTTWEILNNGDQITIPTTGGGYNYDVDWGDASTDVGVTGNISHTYATAGTYTVSISGTFPRIFFNGSGSNRNRIQTIEQWGDNPWTSMNSAFQGCTNLSINAVDVPDLSNVTDMTEMFRGATSLNQDINSWDVGNVTDMTALFRGAFSFNQPLNSWNVSSVTDMTRMFQGATAFNQNISSWNVGNVTDMTALFLQATSFNQSLNTWDVSSVTDMSSMFQNANAFNGDITSWNVSNVTEMDLMFRVASVFNQNISGWNVSSLTTMSQMFDFALVFNQPIGGWNVSNVTNMFRTFAATDFNQNIDAWDVSDVTTMQEMFSSAFDFNQPLNSWNVGNVINMRAMFANAASFNQDLNSWNVSLVTNMRSMFEDAFVFNGAIGNWNVSSVTTMFNMFRSAADFDQPIGSWNVSNVTTMASMFAFTPFNQDISGWNVGSVTNLERMFNFAGAFNQDIGGWNVSNVTNLVSTFSFASAFDQGLGAWDVGNVTNFSATLSNSALSVDNYDQTLIGWAALPSLQTGRTLGASGLFYCNGETARNFITTTYSWTIDDAGLSCPEPEIAAFDGPNNTFPEILDGQIMAIDFGSQVQGSGVNRTFSIENQGGSALTITNITITGSEFMINSAIAFPLVIGPGGSELLDILLTGSSVGVFTETVTIINDDTDEANFNFDITGTITASPEPEIVVYIGPNTSGPQIIDDQAAPLDFGSTVQGSNVTQQITIENQGTADLDLNTYFFDPLSIFFISATPPSTISPGLSETIDIEFDASTIGTFTVAFELDNNDADEGIFDFQLTGEVTAPPMPEISVFVGQDNNGAEIFDGQASAVNVGSSDQGTDITQIFTVANSGSGDLTISNISVTGSAFSSVTATPIVAPTDGANANFTIVLSAASVGTFNETISIVNDDSDENPFNFTIEGTITVPNSLPTISSISDVSIDEDGSTGDIAFTVNDAETNLDDLIITASSDNTNLVANAGIQLGGAGGSRTINVTPEADASGTATITVQVDDNQDVVVETFLITVNAVNDAPVINGQQQITTGQNTPVTLQLDDFTVTDVDNNFPTGFILFVNSGTNYTVNGAELTPDNDFVGDLTVPIVINDGNDDSPVFDATVTVVASEIEVTDGETGDPFANGGTISFDDIPVGATDEQELVISNSGTVTLVITEILVEGDDFELLSGIPDPIAPAASAILLLGFQPTSAGPKSADLTIRSVSAPDFTTTLTASGLSEIPPIEVFNVVTTQQNGKHDFLEIRNIEFYQTNKVFIYSRWGDEVYSAIDYNNVDNRFVGNADDGDELPDGTYYYVVELNGGEIVENGFFLLRR